LLIEIIASIQLECTTDENIIIFFELFIRTPPSLPITADKIINWVRKIFKLIVEIIHRGAIFCQVKRMNT
jgi:hypothetical protein